MATEAHTYSIANDITASVVNVPRLTKEIRESPIVVALDYIDQAGDVLTIVFKAELDAANTFVLDSLVDTHSGLPLPDPTSPEGIPYVQLYGKVNHVQIVGRDDATDFVRSTHNWADKCTWFQMSQRVSSEVLTQDLVTDPSGKTYKSINPCWVNIWACHLPEYWMYIQQLLNPGDPHAYLPVVTINNVLQTERAPFATSGGDYYVDYGTGKIIFETLPTHAPVASYSYPTTSDFIIEPLPGKAIEFLASEGQFSDDAYQNDAICIAFEQEDPNNPGTYLVIGVKKYHTMDDFIDEAKGSYPSIPPMPGPRGYSRTRHGFPMPYMSVRKLLSSAKMRMRVYLENHVPYGGERVTATFYSVSMDETA